MTIRVRRDRHGRGIRGPILAPELPAYKTRAEQFDALLADEILSYRKHLGRQLDRFDFAVLDVPSQDPPAWERGIALGRFIPFARPAKIHGRIIFYRMPIVNSPAYALARRDFVHDVVTGQIAAALGVDPIDIDYR